MVSESILIEVVTTSNKSAGISSSEEEVVVFENDDFTVLLVNSVTFLKEALNVMREGFYPHESICNGVKLGEDLQEAEVHQKCSKNQLSGEQGVAELEMLTLETAKDGVSIVAIEKASKQTAGAAFNKIQRPCASGEKGFFEAFRDNHCQSLSAIALIDSMIEVDSRFDVFEHYQAPSAMEVMFLATNPKFRRRGVGALLMTASFEVARSRNVPLVVALMTSVYTQRIARTVGMQELSEVNHDELNFLEEPISKRTGIHKSTVLAAKTINCA
nr:arylalkylamine N-acetyltransferase like protein [Ischnura senegalensis]